MRVLKSLLLSASAVAAARTVTVTQFDGVCPVPATKYISSTLGVPLETASTVSKTAAKVTSTPASPYTYKHDDALPSDVPAVVLTPKIPKNIDTYDPVHLIPQDAGIKQPLYFEGVGEPGKTPFAVSSLQLTCPSVILDHSSLISIVTYSNGKLTIVFASEEAYQYALKLWECGDEGLFLLTYTEGCGGYNDGERCYFKATDLHFNHDTLSVTAGGKPCSLEEAATDLELEWGYHKPPPKPTKSLPHSGHSTVISTTRSGYPRTSTSSTYGPKPTSFTTIASGTFPSASSNGTIIRPATSSVGSGSPTSSTGAPVPTGSTNGTVTPNNSTIISGNNAYSNGCVAPVDTKYGLPTACLDEYFDVVLDNNYGYDDLKNTEYQAWVDAYAAGTEYDDAYDAFDAADEADVGLADDLSDFEDDTLAAKRMVARRSHLKEKRFLGLPNPFTYIAQKVLSYVPIPGIGQPLEKQLSKSISFAIPKESTLKNKDLKVVTSPWGEAILIKSFGEVKEKADKTKGASLDIYCVDCGVSGSADIVGTIAASLAEGITKGTITLNANFKAGLKIGVDAQAVYKNTYETQLFALPLSPLSIPGIATIGPEVALGAGVEFEAKAQGQLLAGAEFSLVDAKSTIDILDSSKSSSSGWTPVFVPVFQAKGELTVSAELSLPISIGVGISILNGKWKKEVALVDTPSLKAEAAISASAELKDGAVTGGIAETDGCKGIKTSISFKNTMFINILDLQKFWLLNPEYQAVKEGCIAIGDQSSTTPATTTPATTTPATSGTPADPATTPVTDPVTAADPATTPVTDPVTSTDPAATPVDTTDPADPTETPVDSGSDTPTDTPTDDTPVDTPVDDSDPIADPTPADEGSEESSGSDDTVILKKRDIADVIATATAVLKDVTAFVKSNTTVLTYSDPVYPNNPYNTTNETQIYEYTVIQDQDATYNLTSCGNGNMYLQDAASNLTTNDCTAMWASQSDVVVGDATGRLLHYYPNTMEKVNVSRLRLSASDDIPETAVPVFLNWDDEYSTADGDPIYYAVDPLDNIFFPVVCTYKNTTATAKIFLVADPASGIELLQSPDVIYSITGGEVETCYYLPLVQGFDGSDAWSDKDTSSDAVDDDFEYDDAYYNLAGESTT